MSLSSSLLLLLATLLFASASELRVSHQAPGVGAVDVTVNGNTVIAYQDISYGEATIYKNITGYSDDASGSEYLIGVYLHPSGSKVLEANMTFSETVSTSLYIVLDEMLEASTVVTEDNYYEPEQYTGLWKILNLAPQTGEITVLLNGEEFPLETDQVSEYYNSGVATYQITVKNDTATLVEAMDVTLTSGAVISIVFNGLEDVKNFGLFLYSDATYTYETCRIRALNSVPDSAYGNVTIKFGTNTQFSDLYFGETTEYFDVQEGEYVLSFYVGEAIAPVSVFRFLFVQSNSYTVLLQGLGDDLGANVLEDSSTAPLYNQVVVRVVQLVPNPVIQPSPVWYQMELADALAFGGATEYLPTSETSVNVTVVLATNIDVSDVLMIGDDDFEFGSSYSFFSMGLLSSQDYEPAAYLTKDFSPVTTPDTTTSSTTTTTTGGSDDSDDDGGLSGGETAGVVIGVIAGVALLGAAGFFLMKRKSPEATDAQYSRMDA